jgi:tRNA pseudouridine55 synthase
MADMHNVHNGILNINKPPTWTSHDVVAKVRRLLGQRSVGHAGTLDPMATGVLLVCVGQATRVAEYLMASEKGYRATARLGVTTDSYDADGRVTATAPVPELSAAVLQAALTPFVGDILQVPPAYSAIKQDGVPLHKRARRGEVVDLVARPVRIERISLLSWQPPDLALEIACGPGTYVRSLVHDLGQALGCGATLIELTRVRSGHFTIDEAITLEHLAEAATAGQPGRYLRPVSEALSGLVPLEVDDASTRRLIHGQSLPCPVPPAGPLGYAKSASGAVLAILTYDGEEQVWRPRKVFAAS